MNTKRYKNSNILKKRDFFILIPLNYRTAVQFNHKLFVINSVFNQEIIDDYSAGTTQSELGEVGA